MACRHLHSTDVRIAAQNPRPFADTHGEVWVANSHLLPSHLHGFAQIVHLLVRKGRRRG